MLGLVVLTVLATGCAKEATRNEQTGEIEQEGAVDVFSFEVGDCFDSGVAAEAEGESFEVGGVTGKPCSEPHYAEVFHLEDIDAEEYPGPVEVNEQADSICAEAFEGYVGVPYLESELLLTYLTPTAQTWENDDREIVCYLVEPDESLAVGSAKNSKR
jgi:hypothetical protein